jgi:hypothetical protein
MLIYDRFESFRYGLVSSITPYDAYMADEYYKSCYFVRDYTVTLISVDVINDLLATLPQLILCAMCQAQIHYAHGRLWKGPRLDVCTT